MSQNPVNSIIMDVGHINAYVHYLLSIPLRADAKANVQAIQELVADISVHAEILRQDMSAYETRVAKLEEVLHEVEHEEDFSEYEQPSRPKPSTLRDKLRKEMESTQSEQDSEGTGPETY